MRIIRFVADDGRVLCGKDDNGAVAVVRDVGGVLGADDRAAAIFETCHVLGYGVPEDVSINGGRTSLGIKRSVST